MYRTPFFSVVAKDVPELDGTHAFYALKVPDYVTCIAETLEGKLILVRQFRPAVESVCLELPSGHIEGAETPIGAARRELLEETGYAADEFVEIGCLRPDVGRLENRLWCVVAKGIKLVARPGLAESSRVEPVVVGAQELRQLLNSGGFDHALNLGALLLAVATGHLSANYVTGDGQHS